MLRHGFLAASSPDIRPAIAARRGCATTFPVGGADRPRAGAPAHVGPLLAGAEAAFRVQGAVRWADRAAAELRAGGLRKAAAPRAERSVRADELTEREREVCGLVVGGATNAEVAASLFISPRTVEHHLHKIYRKVGVRSRSQLAARLPVGPKTRVFLDAG